MNQAHPNFDPSTKAGAHVLSRVARAVDAMEREQLSSAKLELESSRTFSHLSTQVAQLKRAMSQLADAVVGELDESRADHDAWRRKRERHERVIEEKVAAVDATRADKDAIRRLAREEARSALYELKAEIGNATECVADAKAALAETERRNAETGAALARRGLCVDARRGRGGCARQTWRGRGVGAARIWRSRGVGKYLCFR